MLSISYWMSGIVQIVRNKQQRRHEKVDENQKVDFSVKSTENTEKQ